MDTITHPTDDFQTAFAAKFLYNSRQPIFYSPQRTIMSDYTRTGRAADSLRNIKITPNFLPHADGSCLIECGNTKVICTASIDENVPPFLRGKEQGWVTAP